MGKFQIGLSSFLTRISWKTIICNDKGNGKRIKKALRLFNVATKGGRKTHKAIYKRPSGEIQQFDWNRQTIRSSGLNRWSKASYGRKC